MYTYVCERGRKPDCKASGSRLRDESGARAQSQSAARSAYIRACNLLSHSPLTFSPPPFFYSCRNVTVHYTRPAGEVFFSLLPATCGPLKKGGGDEWRGSSSRVFRLAEESRMRTHTYSDLDSTARVESYQLWDLVRCI